MKNGKSIRIRKRGNHRYQMGWTMLFLLFLSCFYSPLLHGQNSTIVVGLHDIAPLAFLDTDGRAKGFIVDVLEYIAAQEGWEITYQYGTWVQCLDWIQEGEIDLLFPVFVNTERKEYLEFGQEAVLYTWGRVFADRDAKIESILDLQDKVVAVTERDIFYSELKKMVESFGLNTKFIEKETSDEIFRAVSRGEADAGSTEQIDGHLHASKYNIFPTHIVFSPGQAYFVTRKDKPEEWLARIDQSLVVLKADPDSNYYSSYDKWIGPKSRSVFPEWAKISLMIAVLLSIAFISFSAVLRNQVSVKTQKIALQNERLESEVKQRIQAEQAIKSSLKEKETLLQEIHHRVKNNMQIISSLMRMQSSRTSNTTVKAQLGECQNRIQSMALIHQMLYQSDNFTQIDMQAYLKKLIKSMRNTYADHIRDIRIDLKGSEINLDLTRAIPCGLIINELVSNAIKHAFPSKKTGRIQVWLKYIENRGYELYIDDDGIGIPDHIQLDRIETLGLQLVNALVDQLSGQMRIERDKGTHISIYFE